MIDMAAIENSVIKVLLVDDHPVVLQGLKAMLDAEPDFRVVGEARNGRDAIKMVGEVDPDVVLMDIRMEGLGGLEATREIKRQYPDIAVIVLTVYDSDIYVIEAIRAGASGYLVKDSSPELLVGAVKSAVQGGVLLSNELLQKAFHGVLDNAGGQGLGTLTARELEILNLLAEGSTNKVIADKLHLAEITIKKHVQSIMRKMGVSDRTQAAVLAVHLGLVK